MFLFLKEDKRTLQEIFEHIWPEDGNKTSDNAHGLRRQLNIKGSKLDIESLVSEQIEGYYKLTFEEVVER